MPGWVQGKLYRCRKCRRLLATQSNVVPITEGPGSIAFKYRCDAALFSNSLFGVASLHVFCKIVMLAPADLRQYCVSVCCSLHIRLSLSHVNTRYTEVPEGPGYIISQIL